MVQFGLVTDAQMAPDPEAIIAHFRPQFDQLVYHVLMSSWGDADLEAAEPAALYSETETPKAPARKSRPASKPRAKGARTKTAPDVKSAALPELDAEAPVAEARKSRPASKRRTRGTRIKPEPQAQPQTAPEPQSTARRKLPRK
jgi:hypothetical protein